MAGIEGGIDREASQALMCCGKLGSRQRSVLWTILAGGVWTQERAFRAQLQPTAICPHCDSGEDWEQPVSIRPYFKPLSNWQWGVGSGQRVF